MITAESLGILEVYTRLVPNFDLNGKVSGYLGDMFDNRILRFPRQIAVVKIKYVRVFYAPLGRTTRNTILGSLKHASCC